MKEILIAGFAVVGALVLVAGLGLLLAFPIMWCWNATMPLIFKLTTITWGQAWCLNFLCGALIRSTQTNNNK